MAKAKDSLTPKQEKFFLKYVESGSATVAYRHAYNTKNTNDETVYVEACRLLQHPKIAPKIVEWRAKEAKRNEVTIDRVKQEYAKLAFLDIRKVLDDDGNVKPVNSLDDDTAAAIAGIEVEELYDGRGADRENVGRVRKIKLANKLGALDSLAKHLGMFVEKHEHTGKDGKPIEIKETSTIDTARRIAFILAKAMKQKKTTPIK